MRKDKSIQRIFLEKEYGTEISNSKSIKNICDLVEENIKQDVVTVLDFNNIAEVSDFFVNEFYGGLIKKYPITVAREMVVFDNEKPRFKTKRLNLFLVIKPVFGITEGVDVSAMLS